MNGEYVGVKEKRTRSDQDIEVVFFFGIDYVSIL